MDIYHDIYITLKESILGIEKNIEYERDDVCKMCNGVGLSKNWDIACPMCNGECVNRIKVPFEFKILKGVND